MSSDERSDVIALVDKYEHLFRRVAESDLPISKEAQRALQLLDGEQGRGNG